MVLPLYLFSSGLGSKLSTWLTPPQRKIQMTDFALGGKCGLPSGRAGASARTTPSRKSMAPSARPVKPRPVSARNERRVTPRQRCECEVAIVTPSLRGVTELLEFFQFEQVRLILGATRRLLRGDQA